MNKRFMPVALVAALATVCILGSTLMARADNYPVRDGTGASQTFCSKLSGGLQYPCHLVYGMFGSTPVPITSDGSNLNVNVQASALPAGAPTASGQTAANSSLATIATNTGGGATAANQSTANTSLTSIATNTANGAAYNAPFSGVTNMPVDATTYTAGRSFEAECTGSGAVKVTFSDASQRTINVAVGDNIRPYSVTAWTLSGVTGPAACTYANLK